MPLLGRLLLDRGWIGDDQLAAALQLQRDHGHRLGTHLLECDAIAEEALLQMLGQQLRVPVARPQDLARAGPAVTRLLPIEAAVRALAVPFRDLGSRLDLALADVHDLTLVDELARITGKRLRVHAALEVRLLEALESFYGHPCSPRIARLLDRLGRTPLLHPPPLGAQAPLEPSPEAEGPGAAGPDTSGPLAEPPSAAPPPTLRGPEPDESWFERARSSEEIGRVLLELLSRDLDRVILLRVARSEISGWMGRGALIDHRLLDAFRTDLRRPSFFLNLSQGSPFHRGGLTATPVHAALAACWGGEMPSDCLAAPIRVRDRLVAIVYGDRDGTPLAEHDLPRTLRLSAKAALALELCVLRRKLRLV